MNTEVMDRINYWEGKGLRKSRKGSKTYEVNIQKILWTIKGTHIYDEGPICRTLWEKGVDRFAQCTFDSTLLPFKKDSYRALSIGEFIYNQFTPNPELVRLLKHHIKNVPIPIRIHHNQELFKALLEAYVQANGTKSVQDLRYDQIERLGAATYRLHNFFKMYADQIDDQFLKSDRQKAELFIRHVLNRLNNNYSKFGTVALTWTTVWESLPGFFTHHGYFVTTKRKTISEMEEKLNANATKHPKAISSLRRPTLRRRKSPNDRPTLKRKRSRLGGS